MYLINRLRALVRDDSGQDLIEYALLAGLVALAAVGTMGALGTAISDKFDEVADSLDAAPVAP